MQRVLLGILAMFVVGAASDLAVAANSSLGHLLGSTGLAVFLAAVAGAFIARRNFLIPALVIVAITWFYTVYLAYKIASLAEVTSIQQVISNNLVGFVVYLSAGALGALSGMWISSRIGTSNINTNDSLVDSE